MSRIKRWVGIIALALALMLMGGCGLFRPPSGQTAPPKTPPKSAGLYPATTAPGATASATGALPSVTPQSSETPAPAAKKAAGVIPEAQTFMNYSSITGGYDVQVPEGWTPLSHGENIKFTRDYDGVSVEITPMTGEFSVDGIRQAQVAELIRTGRAVDVKSVSAVAAKGGQAVQVEYESNSEPVGGKKVRLINHRYYFAHSDKLAALTMWAPVDADNENIWKQIPDTFLWR